MKRDRVGGVNAVRGLVEKHPERIVQLWIRSRAGGRLDALAGMARDAGIAVQPADDKALARLVRAENHQGVVAEFHPPEPLDEKDLLSLAEAAGPKALFLVLDQVQDPHNLGACLRSAAAAGATAVVVPRDRSAGLTPAVQRASAGGSEHVELAAVANLARALKLLADAGIWIVGLDGEARVAIHDQDLTGPLALVLGSEEKGMRRLTRESCDHLVHIPMPGNMESLNVSVSAGIALFEAIRQRAAASPAQGS